MAERAGISPSPCWTRVKRLEEAGYITGYVALLSQEKLGFPDTVLVEVTLDHHDEETLERFGRALAELPEVLEAYLTTGEYDYLIKVAVAGTIGYERFLRESLYRIPGIPQSLVVFAPLPQTLDIAAPLKAPHGRPHDRKSTTNDLDPVVFDLRSQLRVCAGGYRVYTQAVCSGLSSGPGSRFRDRTRAWGVNASPDLR